MPVLQRPTLWPHVRRWDAAATGMPGILTLDAGPRLVLDNDLIHQVLTRPDRYREQSAFLRTRSFDPLPTVERRQVIRGLMTALTAQPPAVANVPSALLTAGRGYRTQHWGILLMRHLHGPGLNRSGDAELDRLIDFYVHRKTISDDVAGGFRRFEGAPRDSLHLRTGLAVEQVAAQSPGQDLATVVAGLGELLPPLEKGELYLRLVQSIVAFTGSAFEWNVVAAARDPRFRARLRAGEDISGYLHEAQRLFPTAWRLGRVVEQPHVLGPFSLRPGDELILATTAIHRAEAEWEDATASRPQRWDGVRPATLRAYAPFGRGQGMCPGRELAMQTMELCLRHLFDRFDVRVRRTLHRRPYVRSILAAPRMRFRLVPR
jgi:hypothetical protein